MLLEPPDHAGREPLVHEQPHPGVVGWVHLQHHLPLELEVFLAHVVEGDPAHRRREVAVVVAQLHQVGVLDDAPEPLDLTAAGVEPHRRVAPQHVEHVVGDGRDEVVGVG
ncbi:MAG: hypothetical protein ACR2IR_07840 [Acidimicrobiia bacterium]